MDINKNDEISHDNKVSCVYTSVGVNHFSGCSSILAISPPLNPSRVYNILAFGSSHMICLSKLSTSSVNDEMMAEVMMNTKACMDKFCIYQTLFGHTSDVRCIRWLSSCDHHCSSISKIYSHSIYFLMSADNCGTIIIWACSTNHLLHSDQLTSSQFIAINKFQVPKNSSINAIDGFFFPASNSSVHNDQSCCGVLFLSAASDTSVYNWCVNIPEDILTNNAVFLPVKSINHITRNPSLCLCLKTFCVKYNITTTSGDKMHWLRFIVLGLDNGQTEIWSMGLFDYNDDDGDDKESGGNFTLGATLSGHQDWVRCMDVCIDEAPVIPVILIATGGQDSIVRLWRLFSMVNDTNKAVYEHTKVISLQLPQNFSADNLNLCLTSESVLASHENWVTGISWSSTTTDRLFPPHLLTCSMDKSLIVWDPPSENSKESSSPSSSSDVCSLWKEKARLGHFGDTGLSIMDCHWLPSDGSKIFGHTFQGSISIWCKSEKGFWLPALPLTGHVGPVADLTWMSLHGDEKNNDSNDAYTYLLTAGFDQTVRLHACQSHGSIPGEYWYELARPQIHGYDMNAIASISPILYASAGDEKVVRVFKTTKAFLKSFKQLYKSSTVRQKLDVILADNSVPAGAVQPPLGLSNQIVNATSENTNGYGVNNEYDVNHNEYVNDGKAEITNEDESIYDEIPTEDRLQHATLWPEVKKLYGHPYEIYSLAVHPHRLLVASACSASKPEYAHVILWNGNSNWCIHQRLQHHQLTVSQLAWSHDGTRLLAVSRDRTWSLWCEQAVSINSSGDMMNHVPNYYLAAYPMKGQSHSRIIWTCAWGPDDKYFFTGSRDTTVCCWSGSVKTQTQTDNDGNTPPEVLRRLDTYKDFGHAVTALDVCETVTLQDESNHHHHANHSYLMAVGLESGSIILLKLIKSQSSSERFFTWSVVLNFPTNWCHVPGKRLRRISFLPEKNNTNASKKINKSVIHLSTAGDDGLVRVFKVNRALI